MSRECQNNWYVYRHIRDDKNIPFYIGIGKTPNHRRAYSKDKRNHRWNCITNKTRYTVEIVLDNLSKEEAIKKEIEFIGLYGRENNSGILCNQTDGGEGVFGRQNIEQWKLNLSKAALNMTDEHKRKISAATSGHIGYMKGKKLTEEQKNKISIKHKGIQKSDEHKKKLSEVNTGKKLSEETKKKISESLKNRILSDESRLKMSKGASYKRSEETKKNMSEARKRYFQNKKLKND